MKKSRRELLDYEKNMFKIKSWCEKNGLSVQSSGERAEYDPGEKVVCYYDKTRKRKRIYELLHECGHYLVEKNSLNKGDKRYSKQLESLYDGRKEYSLEYRIEVLREEFDAWERGWRLGERLGLNIDYWCYKKFMTESIASYCDWISKKNYEKESQL